MKKITLFLIFLWAFVVLAAQEKQANYSRVKIYASKQEHVNALLKKGVCLENLDVRKGVYIIGEFSDYELKKIQETEIPYEILIENMSAYYVKQNEGVSIEKLNKEMKRNPKTFKGNRTPAHFHLGSMGGYFTLAEMTTELDEMRAEYPNLISEKEAFPQQTIEGRNIYWVKISGNLEVKQDKPRVLYTALTHAREPAGMHQMIYQMWNLLEKYGVDPEITYYLDNLELYFVPCVCPDGYEYNRQTNPYGGGMWRKNRNPNSGWWYGIDLNRNWGYMWGYDDYGSSPYEENETYRGSVPFSEIETQVLRDFCEENEISLCLNNHTYGNYLVYPFGYANDVPTEYPVYRTYAERLTAENRYAYGNTYQILNYYANGSSEDWFCGERETKNLVISFCPEAGDPYEGFWPPASRIEEICAGHVWMNNYLMRLALPYAEIEDKTGFVFQELNNSFTFELISLGRAQNADFEVTIVPVSDNIQSVQTTPLVFENLYTLDRKQGEFSIVLKPDISSDTQIVFDICVNNGTFTHKQRFSKFFGVVEKLFEDDCENMDHWSSDFWGLTTSKYSSPTHSIADSPYDYYSYYANNTIYSKNFYDLTDAIAVFAEFEAQWDIETNYDYVQFLVSANNGYWEPQEGKYTKPGSGYQDFKPVYDGVQMDWVHEVVDLSKYKGNNIKVGFKLVSDGWTERDGFYFDDFVLSVIKPKTNAIQTPVAKSFDAYYNPATQTISITHVDISTTFSFFTIEGKLLNSFSVDNKNYDIKASELPSGIYFLKSNFGEVRKIVVY